MSEEKMRKLVEAFEIIKDADENLLQDLGKELHKRKLLQLVPQLFHCDVFDSYAFKTRFREVFNTVYFGRDRWRISLTMNLEKIEATSNINQSFRLVHRFEIREGIVTIRGDIMSYPFKYNSFGGVRIEPYNNVFVDHNTLLEHPDYIINIMYVLAKYSEFKELGERAKGYRTVLYGLKVGVHNPLEFCVPFEEFVAKFSDTFFTDHQIMEVDR
jgi:hypothetical protein